MKQYEVSSLTSELNVAFTHCLSNYEELLPFFDTREFEECSVYNSLQCIKQILNKLNEELLTLRAEYASETDRAAENFEDAYQEANRRISESSGLLLQQSKVNNQSVLDDNPNFLPLVESHAAAEIKMSHSAKSCKRNITFCSVDENDLELPCPPKRFKATTCDVGVQHDSVVICQPENFHVESTVKSKKCPDEYEDGTAQSSSIHCFDLHAFSDKIHEAKGCEYDLTHIYFKCKLCCKRVMTVNNLFAHLRGKWHQGMLNSVTKQKPELSKNSKSPLIRRLQKQVKKTPKQHPREHNPMPTDTDNNFVNFSEDLKKLLLNNETYFCINKKSVKCTLCNCDVASTVYNVVGHIHGHKHTTNLKKLPVAE